MHFDSFDRDRFLAYGGTCVRIVHHAREVTSNLPPFLEMFLMLSIWSKKNRFRTIVLLQAGPEGMMNCRGASP
jgi:hypothetical protein